LFEQAGHPLPRIALLRTLADHLCSQVLQHHEILFIDFSKILLVSTSASEASSGFNLAKLLSPFLCSTFPMQALHDGALTLFLGCCFHSWKHLLHLQRTILVEPAMKVEEAGESTSLAKSGCVDNIEF